MIVIQDALLWISTTGSSFNSGVITMTARSKP